MTDRIAIPKRMSRALWLAGPFHAESLANGTIRITPDWTGARPSTCTDPIAWDAAGDCVQCGTPHIGGVFDRIALAEIIKDVLARARKLHRPPTASRPRPKGARR